MTVTRSAHSPRKRVTTAVGETDSRTHQSFKDECDINTIVRRHASGDVTHHVNKSQPMFISVEPMDFREALELTRTVRDQFQQLPAQERSEYGNNPENYLAHQVQIRTDKINADLLDGDQDESPKAREPGLSPDPTPDPKEPTGSALPSPSTTEGS